MYLLVTRQKVKIPFQHRDGAKLGVP